MGLHHAPAGHVVRRRDGHTARCSLCRLEWLNVRLPIRGRLHRKGRATRIPIAPAGTRRGGGGGSSLSRTSRGPRTERASLRLRLGAWRIAAPSRVGSMRCYQAMGSSTPAVLDGSVRQGSPVPPEVTRAMPPRGHRGRYSVRRTGGPSLEARYLDTRGNVLKGMSGEGSRCIQDGRGAAWTNCTARRKRPDHPGPRRLLHPQGGGRLGTVECQPTWGLARVVDQGSVRGR